MMQMSSEAQTQNDGQSQSYGESVQTRQGTKLYFEMSLFSSILVLIDFQ